jgi:hypothetical protein
MQNQHYVDITPYHLLTNADKYALIVSQIIPLAFPDEPSHRWPKVYVTCSIWLSTVTSSIFNSQVLDAWEKYPKMFFRLTLVLIESCMYKCTTRATVNYISFSKCQSMARKNDCMWHFHPTLSCLENNVVAET